MNKSAKLNVKDPGSAIAVVIGIVLFMLLMVELIPLFQNGSAQIGALDIPFAGFFGSSGIVVLIFIVAVVLVIIGAVGMGKGKR